MQMIGNSLKQNVRQNCSKKGRCGKDNVNTKRYSFFSHLANGWNMQLRVLCAYTVDDY